MKSTKVLALAIVASVLGLSSCKPEEEELVTPVIPVEEEVITTLNMSFVPASGGETIVMSFVDLDGDGGNDPVITVEDLAVNETYAVSMELLNETENPAEDITAEIEEADEEHQFFFVTTVDGMTIAYNDMDADGNPIGLSNTVVTGDADSGSITVTLRHEPNKDAAGVSDGDITNAGGETDIEVVFPVNVL